MVPLDFATFYRHSALVVRTFRAVFERSSPKNTLYAVLGVLVCGQNGDNSGGVMFADTTLAPSSLLACLYYQDPLTTTAGKELLRQIPFLLRDGQTGQNVSRTVTLVSVDNGKDALLLNAIGGYVLVQAMAHKRIQGTLETQR